MVVAALVILASCEPFPDEQRADTEDAKDGRQAFELWRNNILAGRMKEAVLQMSTSIRSQWVYDRLKEGDPAALQWKVKLQGTARTDLDLWFPEAAADTSRGRVTTLPGTVLADPNLTTLLMGYLKDAQADLVRDFRELQTQNVSTDQSGVSVLIRNRRGEPEIYSLIVEDGQWRIDGHRKK
jgi:hypothetical protein